MLMPLMRMTPPFWMPARRGKTIIPEPQKTQRSRTRASPLHSRCRGRPTAPELRVVPELGDSRQRLGQRRCSGVAKDVVIQECDRVGHDVFVRGVAKVRPRQMPRTLEVDEVLR